MKLTLCTLLASIALLSPRALALGGETSIDLQYGVRDAETLYGVATAKGDLRFVNQGPSAARVRWFDPLRGEEEARVLGPGQVLVSQGQLGVTVSEGTVVLVEKIGPGVIAAGIASIPSTQSFRGCIPTDPCFLVNGAFLPWHRGLSPSVTGLVGGTMCSFESFRGVFGSFSTSSSDAETHAVLGDGSVRFIVESGPLSSWGGQEGEDISLPTHHSFMAGIPSCPELEHGPGMHDSMYINDASSNLGGQEGAPFTEPSGHVLWIAIEAGAAKLEHGPGLHDSVHCLQTALGWIDCPPYEPCDDSFSEIGYEPAGQVYISLGQANGSIWATGPVSSYWDWTMEPTPYGIWTSGTASIWSDGTFTSIAPDGWVDL